LQPADGDRLRLVVREELEARLPGHLSAPFLGFGTAPFLLLCTIISFVKYALGVQMPRCIEI
jgi:hypothetical protein